MSEIGEAGSGRKQDNTLIWVIGGAAVLCVCLVAVAIVAVVFLGGLAFFGVSSSAVQTFPTSPPFVVTPNTSGPTAEPTPLGDELEAGITYDAPNEGRDHVPEGTDVAHLTNPPASGPHYPSVLPPGFYIESAPDGYLIHSLEHGYVIIWYDCEPLSEAECDALKEDIEGLMKASAQTKLIGIPREEMPFPIALTSWTKLAYLEEFDADFINAFIDANILQAPEPNAP